MLTGNPKATFDAFYDAVRHNDVLPAKTTYLLHLATAMAVGCIPCMEYYLKQAPYLVEHPPASTFTKRLTLEPMALPRPNGSSHRLERLKT